jgi:hypothetical protein
MLLVILGAGASYDSAPSNPPKGLNDCHPSSRPPLANQLFGKRHDFSRVLGTYPKCADIVARLRHLGENSIETVLQKYQEEASEFDSLDRLQQLASVRYYLQTIIRESCNNWIRYNDCALNHMQLFDDIRLWRKKDEKVCFVTFNYDQLMEVPLAYAGITMSSLSDYVSREYMLIKLHGSVNWGRVVSTPFPGRILDDKDALERELIKGIGQIKISREFVMGGDRPPHNKDNYAIFPALAIPVQEKVEFECPLEHIKALESFLPHVSKILIIGWRATEKPFLEMLRARCAKNIPQIWIVNGSEVYSKKAGENLEKYGLKSFSSLDHGFTDFVINDRGRPFFSS